MFCTRIFVKPVTLVLALSLAISPNLFGSQGAGASVGEQFDEPLGEQSDEQFGAQVVEVVKKPQQVFAPYWTTEKGFSTIIYIRNVHIAQPLNATVSLVLPRRTIALNQTHVDPLQTVSIEVEKALLERGEKLDQTGGALIDFDAESAGALNAYAHVLDTARSLGLSFPFMQDGLAVTQPIDAVVWYYSKKTDAFIAIQNTKENETSVTPTLFVSGRAVRLGERLLKAHEVSVVKLPSPHDFGNLSEMGTAGLRLEYDGEPGSVLAQGWALDETIGFSAPFTFNAKSQCPCAADTQHLYGTGVEIGTGSMPMPGTVFSPYLAVRNTSDQSLKIKPVFKYDSKGVIEKVVLPKISLGPQKSTVVNLRTLQEQGIIPIQVGHGNIDLQYKGQAGALVAELASVDQNGSFFSPVPLTCSGNKSAHMAFWRTDGDWHSSVTIQNTALLENNIAIQISYPGGIYTLEKSISAGASVMVSVNDLQQSQEPDREGRRIPTDATLGGMNIRSSNLDNGLVINAMLMNPITKTCGSCNGQAWVTGWYLSDKAADLFTIYSGFDPHLVGSGFEIFINLSWSDGTYSTATIGNSSSSNPSVASVSGAFVNPPLAPGTTNLSATTQSYYYTNAACSSALPLTPPGQTLTVIRIDIKLDGTTITGTSRNVVVGQKISLTAEVLPGSVTANTKRWTIPPTAVANYTLAPTSATVTNLTSTSGSAVNFYWTDGADGRLVEFSCKVNGKPFAASATFNVKRPTVNSVTLIPGEVVVTSAFGYLALSCGSPGAACLKWSATVTPPAGFSGSFQWVQIAFPNRRRQLTSTEAWEVATTSGNDGGVPYPFDNDAPDTPLNSNFLRKEVNGERFETYLQFKPSFPSAIWVTLRRVDWGWSGVAVRSGSTWSLVSHVNPTPTHADSITLPIWTQQADVSVWFPES